MNTIITVPSDSLRGLDVQRGDVLRILSSEGDQVRIEIERAGQENASVRRDGTHESSKVRQWLKTARGIVKLAPGETVESVLDDYHQQKYQIER